jgi:hypothetical protein
VTNNKALAAGQKASGWFVRSGGGYRAPERYESDLMVVDPFTGEVKKNVHLRYPNFIGTLAWPRLPRAPGRNHCRLRRHDA